MHYCKQLLCVIAQRAECRSAPSVPHYIMRSTDTLVNQNLLGRVALAAGNLRVMSVLSASFMDERSTASLPQGSGSV
jgi:hypothetical protein